MSLLQDALRRVQNGAAAPGAPLPVPPSGTSPSRPKTRWKLLLGLLGAAFAVGAAGVVVLSRSSAPPAAPVASSPGAAVPAEPPSQAPPAAAADAVPGSSLRPVLASTGLARTAAVTDTPPRRGPAAPSAGAAARESVAAQKAPAPPATEAVRTPADDPTLREFNEGVAALDRGDASDAVRRFRAVTAAWPDRVEPWNGLGLGLLRQGKLDEADVALSRSLSLAPRYVPALLNMGLLRLAQRRPAEGAALFARAADASPDLPAARVNLAVAQSRQGRLADAEATLLDARRRFPGDADVLYHLGLVYDRMGDRAVCVQTYNAFLAAAAGSRGSLEEKVRRRLRTIAEGPPQR